MYFKIPTYKKDFEPYPKLEWQKTSDDSFFCTVGRATLRVFRLGSDPLTCKLIEADGGAWRLTAMESIAKWLKDNLPKDVRIIA